MGLLLYCKAYLGGGGGDASDPDYEFNRNDEDDDDCTLLYESTF